MTYSIVARDAETGELGVGVQTHQPAVGAVVPWVRAGVGAVATQSFANPAFGPQGLALMASGLSAERALAAILAGDDRPAVRQVALVDSQGRVAVHTGDACIPDFGHRMGEGYSVQANMMADDTVPDAMAEMFEATPGRLAVRILAALDAAESEGGDIRGRQSAAILVRGPGTGVDYTWDLRIDNDPEPLVKLRELVNIRLAGQAMRLVDEGGEALAEDPEQRLTLARAAFMRAQELAPSDEQLFWYGVQTLGSIGALDEAMQVLTPLFTRTPNWKELLLRLPMPEVRPLQDRFR